MTEPKVPRVVVPVRMSPAAVSLIERLAEEDGIDRSEMIRRLLSEAVTARQSRPRPTLFSDRKGKA